MLIYQYLNEPGIKKFYYDIWLANHNYHAEKQNRRESAYFWEERNTWFSDIWELKGVKQDLKNDKTRARSAGYCIDLPYRIINMFSCKGDTI